MTTGSDDHDGQNNVYVCGRVNGNAWDGETVAGGTDGFLTKYTAGGTKLWTVMWGGTTNDYANGCAADSSGNVYVAGWATADSVFHDQAALGWKDAILIKYNRSGSRQWTRRFGTAVEDKAHAVAVGSSGNVYVAGQTKGDLNGTNAGLYDVFVAK